MAANASAEHIRWRETPASSNIEAIGWDSELRMYVKFKGGAIYLYSDVPYQRAVAAWRAESAGVYFHEHIKPNYHAVRVS